MPSNSPRFLIVGSGIAGSLLAWELHRLGALVTVCTDSSHPGSSRVAAGLITPITGRRFVKSWNLDLAYPQARTTYDEVETLSGKSIFQPRNILRLFRDEEEATRWHRKSDLPEMQEFVVQEWDNMPSLPGLLHQGGGLEIKGGGWIDMPALTLALRNLMQNRVRFTSNVMDYNRLEISDATVRWQDQEFDHVIFCQGYRTDNPWFNWLTWKPAQGEILTVRIPGFSTEHIINRGIFLLPLGGDLFRCGSTYNWEYLKTQPSPEGRAKLESEVQQLITLPFDVVGHSAGIRPILKDTLPVVGLHPQHRTLGIFNGLGSKGALTAPYLARHFARHLLLGEGLDMEIDVCRNG